MDTYAGNGRFVAKRGLLARLHAPPTPDGTSRLPQPTQMCRSREVRPNTLA